MTCARLSVKVAQGCEKPWSSPPHAAPPRATQCSNSFPKGSRGAHRTSAVPVLPLVAIPHKRTIDPRQPTLPGSGKAGKGALPSTTTRAGSSGKWRRKRNCSVKLGRVNMHVGSRSAAIGLDHARSPVPSKKSVLDKRHAPEKGGRREEGRHDGSRCEPSVPRTVR